MDTDSKPPAAQGRAFARIAFSGSVRRVQAHYGTRERCARLEAEGPAQVALGEQAAALLARTRSLAIASVGADGWPYVQHRGGPAGFVKVLGSREIGFGDFDGNGQFVTLGNLLDNPRVHLLVIDRASRERLKLWGRAQVSAAPETLARLDCPDYPARPRRAVLIRVEAWDFNCHRHLAGA